MVQDQHQFVHCKKYECVKYGWMWNKQYPLVSNVRDLGFIDDKYINLVIVYLNLVTFISTITIIITIKFHLFMSDKYASH